MLCSSWSVSSVCFVFRRAFPFVVTVYYRHCPDIAKTYLKNIQEADTEKKLIGIEIAFKQDMTLSCSDLGSLCKAAEDKRYSLRNNEETLKLKQILFFRTKAEMDAYHDMSRKPEDWTEAEIEQQRSRFCSVWQVIEEAELVDEYEAWKEANPNA